MLRSPEYRIVFSGHLKLGDFGLCRMVDDPQGELMTDCGKPYIKAPEVYQDRPCGFPLDWWSVGIMVYRFITGNYPFKTEKLTEGYTLWHHMPRFHLQYFLLLSVSLKPYSLYYLVGVTVNDRSAHSVLEVLQKVA